MSLLKYVILFFSLNAAYFDINSYAQISCLKYFTLKRSNPKIILNYENFLKALNQRADSNPNLIKKSVIYKEGTEDVFLLKLTDQASTIGSSKQKTKVLITAGIHGNEALASFTALEVIEHFIKDANFRESYELSIIPNLNPEGLITGTRRNKDGIDINRTFTPDVNHPSQEALKKIQSESNFEIALDLHGGNENKKHFFVILGHSEHETFTTQALSTLPDNLVLSSPSNQYPHAIGINGDQRYGLISPGQITSTTAGTLKGFLHEIGIPYTYSMEYPRGIHEDLAAYYNLRLLLSLLESYRGQIK